MKKLNSIGLRSIKVILLSIIIVIRIQSVAQQSISLPRSNPEVQGVSSDSILHFLEAIANTNHEFHSFMVLRHGKVVAEGWWNPYQPSLKHMMYSVSKSFTATAVGFAVTEKRISVNDKVISFFPADVPHRFQATSAKVRVMVIYTPPYLEKPENVRR